jgi:DNA (cytosine-5)-methyltransferase 1
LKYLSVCSGIEAATVAWHSLGWEAVAYSEIERFPSEVLAHHYPSTPNLGDMTKFKEWNFESNVDLLVGGTPCQSFSVAGLRKGLDDPRGNLMLTYLAIADKYRPRWLVWENVPGVLSSNGGKDFGVFLGALGELGYGFAYRILDAQYFGVAQRRRRVFVVGYLGDWRAAAAVLFERHSLQGHPAPSREKRKSVAAYTSSSIGGYSEGVGTLRAHGGDIGGGSENLIASKQWPADISSTLDTTFGTKQGLEDQHVNAGCPMFVPAQPIAFNGQMSNPQTDVDMTQTLQAKNPMAVCLMDQGGSVMNIERDMTGTLRRETHGHEPIVMQPIGFDAYNNNVTGDVSKTIDTGQDYHHVPNILQSMAVRRLTPVECERLQGFGDNYTDIKSKGKPTPDGPRYKALGNSMAVPVMRWIGKKIKQYEELA